MWCTMLGVSETRAHHDTGDDHIAVGTRPARAKARGSLDGAAQRETATRGFWWGVVGIVALAFGVRVAYLYQIEAIPFFYHPIGDAASYWDWAGRVAGGDWIGTETFYQAPAYPYFLALVRLVVGDDLWNVRVVQIALGSVSCGLLALAGRWFVSRWAGLCTGLIVALYGPAIFFDGLIQKATLSLFLMSVLLCLLGWMARVTFQRRSASDPSVHQGESQQRGPSPRPHDEGPRGPKPAARWGTWIVVAFAVGVVLGLLALTREQALLLGVVVLVWLAIMCGVAARGRRSLASRHTGGVAPGGGSPRTSAPTRPPRMRHLRLVAPPGVCLLGMVLVLGLVGWRNYRVGGEVALTTFQAGPNFYIGNHEGATGRYVALKRGHETPPFERQDATELAEAALERSLTPREVSDFWLGQAWSFIKQHPVKWFWLMLYKGVLVWNAYEVPDTESYMLYTHFSWLLGVCGGMNHFGVLCSLAAIGIAVTIRRWRDLWLLYAMIATVAGGVAMFYVFGRYRYPLVPLLAIFAGVGLCEARRVLLALGSRNADRRAGDRTLRPWAVVALAAVVAVATNLPFNPERELDGTAYANLGAAFGQQQNYAGAIDFLTQALEYVPDSVETHYNLGMAHSLTRNHEQALRHFRRAQELDPDLIEVDFQMAVIYEAQGRRRDAIRHYERALTIDPRDEEAGQALERCQRD